MLEVILFLVLIGVILWAVETYVPMSPPVKTVLRIVVVIFLVLYLVRLFGLDVNGPPWPRLR